MNKAQVGLKVSNSRRKEKGEEDEGALRDFVLHLVCGASLHRQRPSLHSPLIFPLSSNLLLSDSDNDVQEKYVSFLLFFFSFYQNVLFHVWNKLDLL